MRVVEVLRATSPALLILAMVVAGTRRRLMRPFARAQAYTPDLAIQLERTSPLHTWWLTRLSSAGVIVPTAQGRYWVDPLALGKYRAARLRRVAYLLVVVTLVLVGLLLRS